MSEHPLGTAGSSVKDFVSNFFKELQEGLDEREMKMCPENEASAKMELNAVATGETSGKGGVRIMGLGGSIEGSKSNTQSQKITVYVKKKIKVAVY